MTLAPPKLLDIVYPVRAGDNNPELKYSLRSLEANYPHATVWIVGYKPPWVTNVEFIPGNQRALRANIYFNLLAACEHPGVGDDIVVFNDDFYITQPVGEIPTYYRGTLQAHIDKVRRPGHWWTESLITTQQCFTGTPLSYELHTPFVASKQLMRETLEQFADVQPINPPQWRTLYGNLHAIGGTPHPDPKALQRGPLNTPFHSTDDGSFLRHYRRPLHDLFPEPSRYER